VGRAAVAALVLLFAFPCFAAAKADITGSYDCEGTNPDGKTYKGKVEISKDGDIYHVKWAIGAGDNYEGIGILEGDVFAVSYYGGINGVVVYRVQKGGSLAGKWSIVGGKGKVYTETLSK